MEGTVVLLEFIVFGTVVAYVITCFIMISIVKPKFKKDEIRKNIKFLFLIRTSGFNTEEDILDTFFHLAMMIFVSLFLYFYGYKNASIIMSGVVYITCFMEIYTAKSWLK